MEIFLNLWDELDDLAHACRHVATSAAVEAVSRARPAATALIAGLGAALAWVLSLKNLI